MICEQVKNIIGFDVQYIEEQSNIMWIDTPFTFADGDGLSIYAEKISNSIRFFDAGETLLHFIGRGVDVKSRRNIGFLTKIASSYGVDFTANGDLQILSPADDFSNSFASFIGALLEIITWEKGQEGVNTDMDLFIQEVALYFKSAYPNEQQSPSPEFTGISGHKYSFDFIHGNKAVLAVSPHPNSVSSALKKIIDVIQTNQLGKLHATVVLDDRKDRNAANNEAKLLSVASDVIIFSSLATKAKRNSSDTAH